MLLWYAAGFLAALAVAWLAALLHIAGRAPIGIISLGVGISLGTVLSGLAASGHRPPGGRPIGRKRLIAGTIILALLTVMAEHAWLYHNFRRQWHEARANSPEAAIFRPAEPWSPSEYFQSELTPKRAALWFLDAALITTAAVGTIWVLNRNQHHPGLAADANHTDP